MRNVVCLILMAVFGTLGCGTKYKGASTLDLPNLSIKANVEQINTEVHYIIQPNGAGSWVKDAPWTEVGFAITNNSSNNITISQIRLVNEKGVFLAQGSGPEELTKVSEEMARASAESAAILTGVSSAPLSVLTSTIFFPAVAAASILPDLIRAKDKEKIETEFRKRQILGGTTLAPEGSIKGSGFFPITPNPQKLAISLEIGQEHKKKEIEISFPQNTPSEVQKQYTQPEKEEAASPKEEKEEATSPKDEIEGHQNPVLRVQQKLKELGYDPGPVDGIMGKKTRVAIKKFQKDKGLAETGEINQATLSSLGVEK